MCFVTPVWRCGYNTGLIAQPAVSPSQQTAPANKFLVAPSCSEDSEKRRSKPELRKMRFEMLHREYEAEIETLQTEVARLRAKNSQLEKLKCKEGTHPSTSVVQSTHQLISTSGSNSLKSYQDDTTTMEGSSSHSDQKNFSVDNFMLLTQKLKKTANAYQKLKAEMERVRQDNTQLRDTSAGYLREIGRLKQTLTGRSPRKYEKYTQAAQQAKLDKSEQEGKQLKRALERSDVYVEELECKLERYKRAHGALEPRTNLSLTLELDCSYDEGSRDSIKFGESDITNVPDSPGARDDCLAVSPYKMEGDEPAAKKFYSNGGVSMLYSPSTNHVHRDISYSPDQGPYSKFQKSSESANARGSGSGSLSDDQSKPSTSYVSSTTPSRGFSTLSLSSGTKFDRAGGASLDNAAERGTCSHWGSSKKSPRRQLEFDTQTRESTGDHLKVHRSAPMSSTSPAENSSSADQRDALASRGKSPEKRKLDNTHDNTLNDLDYTLTEEFVDSVKLLKAAERRIRQKSGRHSDAGNNVGPSTSGASS
eukprot:XP_003724335.2 PREDICTED: uncharacterized protein LOC100893463 [Strongylocentrotus purpuratus]